MCLRQLHEDYNIIYSKMSNIRVCLVLAKEHPQNLDWQLPEKKKLPTALVSDVEDDQKAVAPLN